MAGKCGLHPGRPSVDKMFGEQYCKECMDGITAARKKVDGHVEPKECFIVYEGKDKWAPIDGTGCAHWLSHHLNNKGGSGGSCLAGYAFRVKPVIASFTEVAKVEGGKVTSGDIAKVKVGSIYAKLDKSHCGIVTKIVAAKQAGDLPSITIQNDSSAQHGVKENELATYFKGEGYFLN